MYLKLIDNSAYQTLESIFSEFNVRPTVENKEIAKNYFTVACADFEVFKLIYKDYPALGIYHLEQFHEKLINSFLIICGRAEPRELEQHQKAIDKINTFVKLKLFENSLSIYNSINNKQLDSEIKEIISKKTIVNNPSKTQIESLLLFLNKIGEKSKDADFILKLVKTNTKRKQLNFIQQIIKKLDKILLKKKTIRKQINFEFIEQILCLNYISYRIIFLYLLFCKHYSAPRYLKGETNYFSYFNMDLTNKLDSIKEVDEQLIIDYKKFIGLIKST